MKFLLIFVFLIFCLNAQSASSDEQDFDEKICELIQVKKDPLTGLHLDTYINLENSDIINNPKLLDYVDLDQTINLYNRQICEINFLINKLKYTYLEPNYLIITAELSVWLYTSDRILNSLRRGGEAVKGEIVGESHPQSKEKVKLKLYERVKMLTEGLTEVFKGEKDVFGAFFNKGGNRAILFSLLYVAVSYDLYRRFSSGFSISKNDLDLMVYVLEEAKLKLQKQVRFFEKIKSDNL